MFLGAGMELAVVRGTTAEVAAEHEETTLETVEQ